MVRNRGKIGKIINKIGENRNFIYVVLKITSKLSTHFPISRSEHTENKTKELARTT